MSFVLTLLLNINTLRELFWCVIEGQVQFTTVKGTAWYVPLFFDVSYVLATVDSTSPIIRHVISQDFSRFQDLFTTFSWKKRSSHQGKKEVACIVSKPLVACLWGCGESVNPKLNIQEVQAALSSRPKGDPGPLPIFQDFVLLSNHATELIWQPPTPITIVFLVTIALIFI